MAPGARGGYASAGEGPLASDGGEMRLGGNIELLQIARGGDGRRWCAGVVRAFKPLLGTVTLRCAGADHTLSFAEAAKIVRHVSAPLCEPDASAGVGRDLSAAKGDGHSLYAAILGYLPSVIPVARDARGPRAQAIEERSYASLSLPPLATAELVRATSSCQLIGDDAGFRWRG